MRNNTVLFRWSAALKEMPIFKNYQNIEQDSRKTIMISVSFESCSKMVSQPDEVLHVATELLRLYKNYQFVKLFRMKYILSYLPVSVSKWPSRTSRTKLTHLKQKMLMVEQSEKLLWYLLRASTWTVVYPLLLYIKKSIFV